MPVQSDQRTLSLGSVGEDVQRLQNSLNTLDFGPIDEDGVFGESTKAAIKSYQSSRGLTADGIVGPETWARIFHNLG
ncbi:peptidoglycan-binding domain-containing protein [Leptolyngbya sp. FACHB-8]|uniref:peptidoglycan-binding domain-containing protein n=1 Tax=unclassified Leptolyngbya TaxID=2650499 RepID=UPI001684F237|nr:peptidoglycan-binding domain-containing protein [Leptolyngbya sp. FACHB-8]MBD1913256.1 peptidoglycan-binding protein [Leptolyngbya sp. FACHB-8]